MSKAKIKIADLERNKVAKYIFLGLSNLQIAQKMNCSLSTVAYRSSVLFKQHGVKNRERFIVKVLGEILENNKQKVINAQIEIDKLKENTEKLKEVIYGIITASTKEKYAFWFNEAKRHI